MTTEEMNGLASLARKKAAIMGELKTFAKDKHNSSQNYGYASAETIFNTIRQLMTQHGLVLFMSAEVGEQKEFQSARGTRGLHTTVSYRMTWIDIDTGAAFEDRWLSEGDDYQDKGYSKCATLALKYYLLSSFVVSSGDHADDPDSGLSATNRQNNRQNAQNRPNPRQTPPNKPDAHSASENGFADPSSAWWTDNAAIQRIMLETKLSPGKAASIVGKTVREFGSADELIKAYQSREAVANA